MQTHGNSLLCVNPPADATILNRCQFPSGKGKTWLADVKCEGNDKLVDCNHSGLGQTMCTLLDDVGVRCKPRMFLNTGHVYLHTCIIVSLTFT